MSLLYFVIKFCQSIFLLLFYLQIFIFKYCNKCIILYFLVASFLYILNFNHLSSFLILLILFKKFFLGHLKKSANNSPLSVSISIRFLVNIGNNILQTFLKLECIRYWKLSPNIGKEIFHKVIRKSGS